MFMALVMSFGKISAQETLIDPELWLPEISVNPCEEPIFLENLPSEGGRLCEQYPNYEASPGCTIANGTTTNFGANTLIEDKNYIVNGHWTINVGKLQDFETSLVFRNCNFKIAPGAQITVRCHNNKTMTYDGCDFFSCDQMWRGIVIEHYFTVLGFETPTFNFTNCQIEDAASALWFRNPSLAVVFQINGNTFNNNYIGVTAFKDFGSGAPQWMSLAFLDNTIGATHSLRPFYSPKIPPGWPRAKGGVNLSLLSTSIGSVTSSNYFFFMDYGIICENSVLTSRHNTFDALWGDGIFAKTSSLTVIGGNEFIGTMSFPGFTPTVMQNGINAFSSDLNVSGNTFRDRIRNAIYSRDNFNAELITIDNNFFEPQTQESRYGIILDRSAASESALIPAHNQIFQNHFNSTPSDNLRVYTSIFVQGPNSASDILDIYENQDINLAFGDGFITNSGEGIYVAAENADNIRIVDNDIKFTGNVSPNSQIFGIRYGATYSENCHIDLNSVSGEETTSGPDQYNTFAGTLIHGGLSEVSLCNNSISNGKYGLRFFGNNDYPTISENKIYDHEIGLWINSPVELGYHDGSGNQWLGNYSTWAAQKEGLLSPSPTDPISVRFWVPESDMVPYLPPSSLLSPNPENEIDPMRKWFRFDLGTMIDYCTSEEPIMGLNGFETRIANGISTLTGANLWDARRNVYRKLLEHPEMITPGSPIAAFKEAFQNTSVASFAQFDAYFRSATRFPANEQEGHDNWLLSMRQKQIQSESLLATVNFDMSLATPELVEQVKILNEQIALDYGGVLSAKASRSLQLTEHLNIVFSFNQNLNASNTYEEARKTLNAIKIEHLLGNPMLESQFQSLAEIAAQNEEEVGIAKSEAILQLGNCDVTSFVPENRERQKPINPSKIESFALFSIFPNPGADKFIVSVPNAINGMLRVSDLTGRTVEIQYITNDQSEYTVDLASKPTGLYNFSLFHSSGKLLKTIKISVQR